MTVLALLANLLYCAAYAVDVPLQLSPSVRTRRWWRGSFWVLGTLLVVLLEAYGFPDEILPPMR